MRRRTAHPAVAMLVVALLAAWADPASALPAGGLEPTFGLGGISVADFSDGVVTCTYNGRIPSCTGGEEQALDVIAQADGSVVVLAAHASGGVLVTRFRADGRVDPAFGNAGVTFFGAAAYGELGMDGLGRIYVSWRPDPFVAPGSYALTRLRASGAIDPTYGIGGTVLHPMQERWKVAPTGQVYLYRAGIEDDGARSLRVRLLGADGTPDPSYGTGGTATLLVPATTPDGWIVEPDPVVELGPRHEIVVLQRASIDISPLTIFRVVLGRLDPDGRPDLAFSPAGGVRFPTGPAWFPTLFQFSAASLAVLPDGRILVGGTRPVPDGSALSIVRLDAIGDLDPTFAFGGIAVVDLTTVAPASGQSGERLTWLGTDAVGRAVVVGATGVPESGAGRRHVVRLGTDGFPDPSFGLGGTTTLPLELEGGGSTFTAAPGGAVIVGGLARATDRRCGPATALVRCADLLLLELRG